MWHEDKKPLPTETWRLELEKLAGLCASLPAADAERAVRRAYHLLALSPLAIRRIFGETISESELEEMLDLGQADSLAMDIVHRLANIRLVRVGPANRFVAEFHLEQHEMITFEGASPALAIVGAWASWLKTVSDH